MPSDCRNSLMQARRSLTKLGKRSKLWDSVHAGLQLLQTHGSRNMMLSFDKKSDLPDLQHDAG